MLNSDTCVVVCGYAGDAHQIEQAMPWYVHHECPVVVMSPTDAPITTSYQTGVVFRSAGKKGWIGRHTLERQRDYFRMMLEYPFGHFLMHDADSVCLAPKLPKYLYESPDTFWSNEVTDTNPGPSHLPKLAFQPPYFTSRKVIEKLVVAKEAESYYGDYGPMPEQKLPIPTNCIDHFLLQLVYGAGVPHISFPHGASFETNSEHGIQTMRGLVREHGRIFLHSVKTRPVLDQLLADRAIYLKK